MRAVSRVFARVVLLLFIGLGLLWPVVFSPIPNDGAVYDPVVISSLRAEYTVDRDGLMQANETITAEFPSGRHGIFRFWDVANINNSHLRQIPEIVAISMDDWPVPFEVMEQDNDRFLVAKIGDPESTLTAGTHVFGIQYRIAGVLDPGDTGAGKQFASSTGDASAPSAFFWNVIAPGWNNQIMSAEVSVSLPGPVPGAQCSVGAGVGRACDGLRVSGDTVTLSAGDLPPRTPITVRAGVGVPTPPRAEVPWSWQWDPVLGRSVPVVLWLIGLTAAAGLGAFLWWRSTVEPSPGFPLQYAPPTDLGPVQCEYIRTEKVPEEGLTATLFYLADRGLLTLDQDGKKKWTVHSVGDSGAWAEVDPVSGAVSSALGLEFHGTTFHANGGVAAGRKLTVAKQDMVSAAKEWAIGQGLIAKHPSELWLRVANIAALVLAVGGFIRLLFPITLWGLPFAVFFLLSLRAWTPGIGLRRTGAGRRLWSEVGGFHRMLATDSAESRFDFSARKDLYTAYIPFAVAGGTAALWAAKYQASTGQQPPQPDWYHSSSSTGWSSSSAGGASFDSFESALSSSIGAYTASQSSSSSGGAGAGAVAAVVAVVAAAEEEAVHGDLCLDSRVGHRGGGADRVRRGLQQAAFS